MEARRRVAESNRAMGKKDIEAAETVRRKREQEQALKWAADAAEEARVKAIVERTAPIGVAAFAAAQERGVNIKEV